MLSLVGLAFDETQVDRLWRDFDLKSGFDVLLADDFRLKVDDRSIAYHGHHINLLHLYDQGLRRGGFGYTWLELMTKRFRANIVSSPVDESLMAMDYELIRFHTTLAMIDDALFADHFLKALLKKIGFLKDDNPFSVTNIQEFQNFKKVLEQVTMQTIIEVGHDLLKPEQSGMFVNLIRNYIDFLNYTFNNKLTPFFFHEGGNMLHWSSLVMRDNQRNEMIVDMSFRPKKRKRIQPLVRKKYAAKSLQDRMKVKREIESLMGALSDPDVLVVKKSLQSLTLLGASDAHQAIFNLCKDESSMVQHEAVNAITELCFSQYESELIKLYQRSDRIELKLTLAKAFLQRGLDTSIHVLLKDINEHDALLSTVLSVYPHHLERFTKDLISKLEQKNPKLKENILFILGAIPGNESVIESHCFDHEPNVQTQAMYALWQQNPDRAQKVAQTIHSKDQGMQEAVSFVLSKEMF